MRYLLALLFTLYMGEEIIFHNNFPEWYWLAILLTGIMWVFSFGIAEKIYKKDADWSFKKYPLTNIGIIGTSFSGVMAIIQLILIMP